MGWYKVVDDVLATIYQLPPPPFFAETAVIRADFDGTRVFIILPGGRELRSWLPQCGAQGDGCKVSTQQRQQGGRGSRKTNES